MTKFWMNVSKLESWLLQWSQRRFMIGSGDRWLNTLSRIRPNDMIAEYASSGAHGFVAVVQARGYVYEDHTVFWSHGLFPYRIDCDPVIIGLPGFERTSGKAVSKDLDFVLRKDDWGMYFQTKLREISAHDFEVIQKAVKEGKDFLEAARGPVRTT